MTREEFAQVTGYLSAAVNKPMPREQIEVYFDLLKDLPAVAVGAAARQALVESQYPTIPPVGVIRQLATRAVQPEVPTWGEAFQLTLQAVREYGLDGERKALQSLPPVVALAARCMGWRSLCDATNLETVRAQFRDVYTPIAARDDRRQALPQPVREALEVAANLMFRALPGPQGAQS